VERIAAYRPEQNSPKRPFEIFAGLTRRHYSAEEKIRIVLEGLRGESGIAELCCQEGFNQNLYCRWSQEFLEALRHVITPHLQESELSLATVAAWVGISPQSLPR
jgi:transposase-like protein